MAGTSAAKVEYLPVSLKAVVPVIPTERMTRASSSSRTYDQDGVRGPPGGTMGRKERSNGARVSAPAIERVGRDDPA